jgi:GNAT superfamily N-acetyltransferase
MSVAHLPALEPDIDFALLPHDKEAIEFSFAAKREALGPHIRARWTWDEDYQRRVHQTRFAEKPFFAIWRADDALGVLSWWVRPDHARFGEFYLFERYQRRGLGSRILKHALAQADAATLPVRLEYLKWNPVGVLYKRNGFVVTGETDIHFFLERPPSAR